MLQKRWGIMNVLRWRNSYLCFAVSVGRGMPCERLIMHTCVTLLASTAVYVYCRVETSRARPLQSFGLSKSTGVYFLDMPSYRYRESSDCCSYVDVYIGI